MGDSYISCCLTHTPIRENSSVGFMLIAQNPQPAKTLVRPRNVNTYWTPLTPLLFGKAGANNDVKPTLSVVTNDVRELVTTGLLSGVESFRHLSFASTEADFGEPSLSPDSSFQDILDMARSGRLTCMYNLYLSLPCTVALWVAHTWAIDALALGGSKLSMRLLDEQILFTERARENGSQLAQYLWEQNPYLRPQSEFALFLESTSTLCNPTAYGRSGPHLGVYLKHYGRLARAPLDSPEWDMLVGWDLAFRWTGGLLMNMQDSHMQFHPAASHGQDDSTSPQVALAQAIIDNATKVDND